MHSIHPSQKSIKDNEMAPIREVIVYQCPVCHQVKYTNPLENPPKCYCNRMKKIRIEEYISIMGINYFLIEENGKSFHIGKSSVGWEFIWRTQPSLTIHSPNQWRAFLESKVFCKKMKSIKIEDDSCKQISTYDFLHSVSDNNVRKKFSKDLKKINEKEYTNSDYDVKRYTEDYYDIENSEGDLIFNFDFS